MNDFKQVEFNDQTMTKATDAEVSLVLWKLWKGETMITYYKFLTGENKGEYSGFDYSDYLPRNGKPGKWLPKIDDLEMCAAGYHVCEKDDFSGWRNEQLYEVKLRGKTIVEDSKTVGQQMRFLSRVDGWNERNLRLAACEIAKKCLKKYWKNPDDTRPMDAIIVAKRYANGKATVEELAAARSAADSAAWSAARSAAWSAADSAAWSAAESAARSAAWSAADSAARSATWSAADSAARSAADSAAWSAARSAAWSAARSATWKIIIRHCGIK